VVSSCEVVADVVGRLLEICEGGSALTSVVSNEHVTLDACGEAKNVAGNFRNS
jgi:hypothetical protein